MSSTPRLTPFSYTVLALVGRDGAGPHEIVQMMRDGAVFWTTSESHFYAEPKRLARLGFLEAEKRPGQTRERAFYRMTEAGREALADWLHEPAAMPRIQNEAAVKLLASELVDPAITLESLASLRAENAAQHERLRDMEERAAGLPHRARSLSLLNRLARRTLDTQREWLDEVDRELSGGGAG